MIATLAAFARFFERHHTNSSVLPDDLTTKKVSLERFLTYTS